MFQQQMDRQPLLGGELELRFIWDKLDNNVPPPPYVQITLRCDFILIYFGHRAAVAKTSRPPTDYDDRARGPPSRRDDAYNDSRGGRFGSRGGARERSPDYRGRRGKSLSDPKFSMTLTVYQDPTKLAMVDLLADHLRVDIMMLLQLLPRSLRIALNKLFVCSR